MTLPTRVVLLLGVLALSCTGKKLCGPENCNGCCDADGVTCNEGTSELSCGKPGTLCRSCPDGYFCKEQVCTKPAAVCVGGILKPDGGCDAKCDASKCAANNTCVDNACALKCTSHLQCASGQRCLPAVEDGSGASLSTCQPWDMKDIGTACPAGNECANKAVANFCKTTGPQDANAYCTGSCAKDDDCPGGYSCGVVRDPHALCGTKKGNNNFCGKTTAPCISPTELAGRPDLVEGAMCIERRVCLKRDACTACSSDVDCSLFPGQSCITIGAGKFCAPACSKDADCDWDKKCDGNFCKPIFGACTGTGFCAPCKSDLECEPSMECAELHGNERSCVDVTFSTSCNVDSDCTKAPSGRQGTCMTLQDQNGNPVKRCYAPFSSSSNVASCYFPR